MYQDALCLYGVGWVVYTSEFEFDRPILENGRAIRSSILFHSPIMVALTRMVAVLWIQSCTSESGWLENNGARIDEHHQTTIFVMGLRPTCVNSGKRGNLTNEFEKRTQFRHFGFFGELRYSAVTPAHRTPTLGCETTLG